MAFPLAFSFLRLCMWHVYLTHDDKLNPKALPYLIGYSKVINTEGCMSKLHHITCPWVPSYTPINWKVDQMNILYIFGGHTVHIDRLTDSLVYSKI